MVLEGGTYRTTLSARRQQEKEAITVWAHYSPFGKITSLWKT
jgi:hypothetical protein